jgi:pyruvate dehydrogenase E2 component (dihydrolipoamide acetyltransferase)
MASVIQSISTPSSRPKASPVARKAAAELGVDLSTILKGSGPDGRILLEDVKCAAKQSRVSPSPVIAAPVKGIPAAIGGSRRPMDKMRKAIARNLTLSKQTVPHWYASVSVDAQPMLDFYKTEKKLYPCSLNDVVIMVCGRIVQEMPQFRSQADGDDVVQFETVNIGLAVALETGLVVPVVKNVDHLNLKGIASESRRVIEAAKSGKLEGIGEGMFTISNLGMFGVEDFAAIINPPESGILAVGAVREEAIVKDGALRIGKKMTVTLSADHRIIDGVTSAKFLARFKELIENPSLL